MTESFTFAFPGRLELNTGGYAYDRRVMAGLAIHGFQASVMPLGDGFPAPSDAVLAGAEKRLSALPDETLVLIDGLAFGVLDGWAAREGMRLKIVALVHHPLALETALAVEERNALAEREARALSFARHVVVTSHTTARELAARYDVAPQAITVALPGTDPAPRAMGENDIPRILSIGTLTHRKGHDILLDALKKVEDRAWVASIIGSRDLDPATATALKTQLNGLGLEGRVTFQGEIADTRQALAAADIFALASRYEGYGMVFAEALAQGLPIVACDAGAVPDVVPPEAGILVPVDDADTFADALRRLLTDPQERRRRAEAAFQAGLALPRWNDTAATMAGVLGAIR